MARSFSFPKYGEFWAENSNFIPRIQVRFYGNPAVLCQTSSNLTAIISLVFTIIADNQLCFGLSVTVTGENWDILLLLFKTEKHIIYIL